MRVLGVDPGARRIGFAVADDGPRVATPLGVETVHGMDAAVRAILRQAGRVGAELIVIGRPTRSDGRPTAACRRSDQLARALEAAGLAVIQQSEVLTTDEARRRAREAGVPADRPVDHYAAQVLLEEFLSSRSGSVR